MRGLISKLLVTEFSWCPWSPGTLKLDSIISLFKCASEKAKFELDHNSSVGRMSGPTQSWIWSRSVGTSRQWSGVWVRPPQGPLGPNGPRSTRPSVKWPSNSMAVNSQPLSSGGGMPSGKGSKRNRPTRLTSKEKPR